LKGKILNEGTFIHNYNILDLSQIMLLNKENKLLCGMYSENDEILTLKNQITELENIISKNVEYNKIFEERYEIRKKKLFNQNAKILNLKKEIVSLKDENNSLMLNEKMLNEKLIL